MQVLCSLLLGLACFGHGTASEIVEVDAGEPFILNFGCGSTDPTVGIRLELTKDGEKVVIDNTRIFQQHDKLYFTEVKELDSGEYRLTITGNGIDSVEKIIVLSGMCYVSCMPYRKPRHASIAHRSELLVHDS